MTNDTSEIKKSLSAVRAPTDGARAPSYASGGVYSSSAGATRERNTPDSSYQNYLFGNAGASDTPAWSDSTKGRAAIRLLSRGVVGAAFFTIGGRMASKQLHGYNQENWKPEAGKPLQAIAKGIDATLGRAIEGSVRGLAKLRYTPEQAKEIGKAAVTFRTSRHFAGSLTPYGRSYGADIVGFTFDFAMASVGDATTRNIVQAFDPNVKKTWRVNDKGDMAVKGERWHFLPGEFLKWTGQTAWRVFSNNQGEDWAAAIPYAFQMKFQRQFLSKIFNKGMDGHKMVFDHSWNGGAYRVNQQGKIVGDYQLAGAIDLHARFVGYNWYTLMFREGYNTIGRTFSKWKDEGFAIRPQMPEHLNPITAMVDGIGSSLRYVTKSFIKANMYMNPAVIPFWLIRVPQSKWRGEHFVNDADRSQLSAHPSMNGGKLDVTMAAPTDVASYHLNPFSSANYEHYDTTTTLGKVEKGFSRVLNPVGWVSNKAGTGAIWAGEKILGGNRWPKAKWFNSIFSQHPQTGVATKADRNKFMREYVDASLSYTPYMWAKAETGLRVDDNNPGAGKLGQMDQAIYRFMDDVAAFKLGDWGKDLKHMWKLGTNFERDVKAREGGDIDSNAQEIVRNTVVKPASTIQASSATHHRDPATLARADAANDPRMDTGNTAQTNRWQHAVAANDHSILLAGNATRH